MATITKESDNTFTVTPNEESQITLATADTYVDKNIIFNILNNNKMKTESEWLSENPILKRGEIAIVIKDGVNKIKIGDGVKRFSQLEYFSSGTTSGGNGSGVQSDWDVNDPNSPAYIRNRPFHSNGSTHEDILLIDKEPETLLTVEDVYKIMSLYTVYIDDNYGTLVRINPDFIPLQDFDNCFISYIDVDYYWTGAYHNNQGEINVVSYDWNTGAFMLSVADNGYLIVGIPEENYLVDMGDAQILIKNPGIYVSLDNRSLTGIYGIRFSPEGIPTERISQDLLPSIIANWDAKFGEPGYISNKPFSEGENNSIIFNFADLKKEDISTIYLPISSDDENETAPVGAHMIKISNQEISKDDLILAKILPITLGQSDAIEETFTINIQDYLNSDTVIKDSLQAILGDKITTINLDEYSDDDFYFLEQTQLLFVHEPMNLKELLEADIDFENLNIVSLITMLSSIVFILFAGELSPGVYMISPIKTEGYLFDYATMTGLSDPSFISIIRNVCEIYKENYYLTITIPQLNTIKTLNKKFIPQLDALKIDIDSLPLDALFRAIISLMGDLEFNDGVTFTPTKEMLIEMATGLTKDNTLENISLQTFAQITMASIADLYYKQVSAEDRLRVRVSDTAPPSNTPNNIITFVVQG